MKLFRCLLLFLLLGGQLSAQNTPFNNAPSTSKKPAVTKENRNYELNRWAIKYNISSAALGEFPVSVEFALLDNLTIEAGIGLLHKNYIESIFYDPFRALIPLSSRIDFACEECDFSHSLNTSYFIKARFFDYGSYYDGDYYALGFNYRPYVGTATASTINGSRTTDWRSTVFELSALKGRQTLINDKLIVDVYSGVGVQYKQMDIPFISYSNNDILLTELESQGMNIVIRIGIVLGLNL